MPEGRCIRTLRKQQALNGVHDVVHSADPEHRLQESSGVLDCIDPNARPTSENR